MDLDEVHKQAKAWLETVLTRFHQQHPDRILTGIACEVDPGNPSLYVHLCCRRQPQDLSIYAYDPEAHPQDWPHTFAEQSVGEIPDPAFLAWHGQLLHRDVLEGTPWPETEALLEAVLYTGIGRALAELEQTGLLQRCGFAADASLSMISEDDPSLETGRERVRVCKPR